MRSQSEWGGRAKAVCSDMKDFLLMKLRRHIHGINLEIMTINCSVCGDDRVKGQCQHGYSSRGLLD